MEGLFLCPNFSRKGLVLTEKPMKKYLMIFGLGMILTSLTSFAQTVGGVDLAEIDTRYMEIRIESFAMKNHVEVQVDYGQVSSRPRIQYEALLDENAKAIKFNSTIEALNFMYEHGYELTCNYDGNDAGNLFRFYILKRRTE